MLEQSTYIIVSSQIRGSKTYRRVWLYCREDFSSTTWSWLGPGLAQLAERTALKPITPKAAWALHKGLSKLDGIPAWLEQAVTPPEAINARQVVQLFSALESLFEGEPESKHVQESAFRATRHFLESRISLASPDLSKHRLRRLFRARLTYASEGRKLISEVPGSLGAAHLARVPLAALPHENIADLIAKTGEVIDSDIEAITSACTKTLDAYEGACAELQKLRRASISAETEEELRRFIRGANINAKVQQLGDQDALLLSALYLQIGSGLKPKIEIAKEGWHLGGRALAPRLCAHLGYPTQTSFQKVARLDAEPYIEVIVACALLIQLRTKWNHSSVVSLTKHDIRGEYPFFKIQAVKTKTQDHTPIAYTGIPADADQHLQDCVYFAKDDDAAARAIQTLLRILQTKVERGIVPSSEVRLWLSHVDRGKEVHEFAGFAAALRQFIKKHGLPRFSWEMVRVQALASMGARKGGFAAAVDAAGHTHPWTTASYVDKLILRSMNAAISLEFERRFDAMIRAGLEEKSKRTKGAPPTPIGDGSSCRNPRSPPVEEWIKFGMCDGKRCHLGEGCENRVIELNDDRIEELVRTKRFYETACERLYEANPIAFEHYHLPSVLFNLALYQTVQHGPYRHVLRRFE